MTKKAGEGKGGFSHPAFKGNLFKKTSLSYLDICINHRRISTPIPNAFSLNELFKKGNLFEGIVTKILRDILYHPFGVLFFGGDCLL